jgi:hypothetical protein
MPLKEPGRSELPKFVPDHVFRHENRNKLFPVMNRERMSDHIWNDGRPSRPGLNDLAILVLIHPIYFFKQMIVNECALAYRPRHLVLLLATGNNELVGRFIVPGLVPLGRKTPWGDWMGITLPRLSFAAAMRVVDRIHHDTTHMRASAQPSIPTCLPHINILMVRIANLPNGRHARRKDSPHFTGPESHLDILAITSHDLSGAAGAANQLTALSGLQLDIMDRGSQWHTGQWQRIPNTDLGSQTSLHHIANLEPDRSQDITLLAILVVHQGNASRTIRVVFQRGNGARDARLIPLKINLPIETLMPAPTETNSRPPIAVPGASTAID